MANELQGKRVAILAAEMFERVELEEPRAALEEAGASVEVVSLEPGEIHGFDHFDAASSAGRQDGRPRQRRRLRRADAPRRRRQPRPAPQATRRRSRSCAAFFEQGKPVAAICHGPWTLIEAGVVRGRTVTSWPTLRTDSRNAGGEWVDREVVVDGGLVTSRKPDDIPAFNAKMIEEFAEGRHDRQRASVESEAAAR